MKHNTNTNPKTGVRYTVYSLNRLNPDLAHNLMYGTQATNLTYEAWEENTRKDCEIEASELGFVPGSSDWEDFIDSRLEDASESYTVDEEDFEGEYEGVKYGISWLGGAPLLWVFESPFKGTFDLCSPCVPNACNGDNPSPDGEEGYATPDDWRN